MGNEIRYGYEPVDGADITNRERGNLTGCPWTAIGTGTGWVTLCSVPIYPATNLCRCNYQVTGRFSGAAPIVHDGSFRAINPTSVLAVIQAYADTYYSARVRLNVNLNEIEIQAQQDATNDWEFQAQVASQDVFE